VEKRRLGDIEVDLAELERLAEFAIVALIAYAVGDSVQNSLVSSGFPLPQATLGLWVAFFLVLLIYYKAIRVVLNINR
jgi:hypothetical protein